MARTSPFQLIALPILKPPRLTTARYRLNRSSAWPLSTEFGKSPGWMLQPKRTCSAQHHLTPAHSDVTAMHEAADYDSDVTVMHESADAAEHAGRRTGGFGQRTAPHGREALHAEAPLTVQHACMSSQRVAHVAGSVLRWGFPGRGSMHALPTTLCRLVSCTGSLATAGATLGLPASGGRRLRGWRGDTAGSGAAQWSIEA